LKTPCEKEEQVSCLIQEISPKWSDNVKSEKGWMKKNELERVNKQKKEYRGLPNVYISKLCTWRCIQKNIVTANHCGNPSPMALVEQYIVSLMQQMAKM
jgi:hypothetical protein